MKTLGLILFTLSSITFAKVPVITKSIYGVDTREYVNGQTPAPILDLADSVGLIFYKDDLIKNNGNLTVFANIISEKPPIGQNLCKDQRFSDSRAYRNGCTGFIVGKDLIATAGHCFLSKFDCDKKAIVFDIRDHEFGSTGFSVKAENIYNCKKVIAQKYDHLDTLMDYAIIQVDRNFDRPILKVRPSGNLSNNDNLFMLGHPLGLPLIYSPDASLLENKDNVFFKATLNSFHGNSGSPVFNTMTNLVEGILVRGESDFNYDSKNGCNQYAIYQKDDEEKGEGVTRIKHVYQFLYSDDIEREHILLDGP